MVSVFTLITIITIFIVTSVAVFFVMMRQRLFRLNQLETHIANRVNAVDTTRLQSHLQDMTVSVVEIDAEVAALKEDLIAAAHKHHLKVDENDTEPELKVDPDLRANRIIRVLETKTDNRSARVS